MRVQLTARQAPAGSRLTYRRSDPTTEAAPAMDDYVVNVQEHRRLEGDLVDAAIAPIPRYLEKRESPAAQTLDWPQTPQTAWAFYMVFDPPLDACPPSLAGDEVVACKSRVEVYNWKGRRLASGSAKRAFRFRGYEDVVIDQHRYADCVRLRVETRFAIPLAGNITATDYVWLAPRIGPVRRVQTIRGLLLARRLSSVIQWDLVRFDEGDGETSGLPLFGPWRRIAAHMHPANSKTRLWGLVIEPGDSNQ